MARKSSKYQQKARDMKNKEKIEELLVAEEKLKKELPSIVKKTDERKSVSFQEFALSVFFTNDDENNGLIRDFLCNATYICRSGTKEQREVFANILEEKCETHLTANNLRMTGYTAPENWKRLIMKFMYDAHTNPGKGTVKINEFLLFFDIIGITVYFNNGTAKEALAKCIRESLKQDEICQILKEVYSNPSEIVDISNS